MNDKSHWERLYTTHSAQEMSWFQPHADLSIALIQRVTEGIQRRVIDVGGGASTLVDDLVRLGTLDISVLDISSKALQIPRERLGWPRSVFSGPSQLAEEHPHAGWRPQQFIYCHRVMP